MTRARLHPLVLFLAALLLAGAPACAQSAPPDSGDGPATGATLALLPLANPTGAAAARDTVVMLLHAALAERGVPFLAEREIRPVLRRHRIRAVGMVDREGARLVAAETGAGLLLTGTVGIYRERPALEIAVSLRLLDPATTRVIAAESRAIAAPDLVGLFGVGMPETLTELAAVAVTELVDALAPSFSTPSPPPERPRTTVALVPFSFTGEVPAESATVLVDFLLSRLVSRGYLVIEPGIANFLFQDKQVAPRGGIDLQTLSALHDDLGVDVVVTGEIDRFDVFGGDSLAPEPAIAFGARMLDAGDGRILVAREYEFAGPGGEFLFGAVRRSSLGELALDFADAFLDEMVRSAPPVPEVSE